MINLDQLKTAYNTIIESIPTDFDGSWNQEGKDGILESIDKVVVTLTEETSLATILDGFEPYGVESIRFGDGPAITKDDTHDKEEITQALHKWKLLGETLRDKPVLV